MKKFELKKLIKETLEEVSNDFKQGDNIKVIVDKTNGDLPKSIIGRRGSIYQRREDQDDMGEVNDQWRRVRAYEINVQGRKRTYIVWEDEIQKI